MLSVAQDSGQAGRPDFFEKGRPMVVSPLPWLARASPFCSAWITASFPRFPCGRCIGCAAQRRTASSSLSSCSSEPKADGSCLRAARRAGCDNELTPFVCDAWTTASFPLFPCGRCIGCAAQRRTASSSLSSCSSCALSDMWYDGWFGFGFRRLGRCFLLITSLCL